MEGFDAAALARPRGERDSALGDDGGVPVGERAPDEERVEGDDRGTGRATEALERCGVPAGRLSRARPPGGAGAGAAAAAAATATAPGALGAPLGGIGAAGTVFVRWFDTRNDALCACSCSSLVASSIFDQLDRRHRLGALP